MNESIILACGACSTIRTKESNAKVFQAITSCNNFHNIGLKNNIRILHCTGHWITAWNHPDGNNKKFTTTILDNINIGIYIADSLAHKPDQPLRKGIKKQIVALFSPKVDPLTKKVNYNIFIIVFLFFFLNIKLIFFSTSDLINLLSKLC